MKWRNLAALTSLWMILGLHTPAPAHAGDGNGIIYGSGGDSCGSWLEQRKSGDWYQKGQWMLGFVTAASVFQVVDMRKTDSAAFAAFADKYCAEHPLDDFSEAVRALLLELKVTQVAPRN